MNTAWSAASEDMYKANNPQGGGDGNPDHGGGAQQNANPTGNAENVTDVDFEEVK